ncbi:MAG: histidine kinase, partial [Saprospiraceae bacterium]
RLYFHHGLNPLLLDNIQFRHRLTGDSNWSALHEMPWVEYPRLAPGRYLFEVVAEKYGLQSAPYRVELYIAPVWWQNPWFWLAALAGVIGVAVFLRNKERKIAGQQIQLEKTKTEMALLSKEKDKLQVQAIVNQLNPHFINNALQWLQVRVDEDEEAVKVVGKLSENIATVFKNSRQKKPYHALLDEMKLAENYLFIQKCRFRERLHYDLPAEAELREMGTVDVPLMIIQIHVENAVEHGIRSKTDGTGRVQIALRGEAEYVTITVTDDGVGRRAAQQIGSRGTQNGTLMLQELATIYNRQNRLPIEQQYEDGIFTTPDGKIYGTRVIIRIPKIYQYDL